VRRKPKKASWEGGEGDSSKDELWREWKRGGKTAKQRPGGVRTRGRKKKYTLSVEGKTTHPSSKRGNWVRKVARHSGKRKIFPGKSTSKKEEGMWGEHSKKKRGLWGKKLGEGGPSAGGCPGAKKNTAKRGERPEKGFSKRKKDRFAIGI